MAAAASPFCVKCHTAASSSRSSTQLASHCSRHGHPSPAGWAVRAAVPTSALAVLPDGVDTTTAAALPLAGLTALRLVRAAGPLTGRRLLITGASGGVGHYVVELAAAVGADITAVSATPGRGAGLAKLGAGTVVHEVADARGTYDVVMESVGGDSLPVALAHLVPDGLLIWFGQASRTPVTLNFFDFFTGPVGAGIRHFDYTRGTPGFAPDLATLTRLVAEDRLHPAIGTLRPWTDVAHVLADLRARRVRGNAVLTIWDSGAWPSPPRQPGPAAEIHRPAGGRTV